MATGCWALQGGVLEGGLWLIQRDKSAGWKGSWAANRQRCWWLDVLADRSITGCTSHQEPRFCIPGLGGCRGGAGGAQHGCPCHVQTFPLHPQRDGSGHKPSLGCLPLPAPHRLIHPLLSCCFAFCLVWSLSPFLMLISHLSTKYFINSKI